jgi:hypothetical protein
VGLFGKRAKALEQNYERSLLVRNLNDAEARHLEVLRREIANLIVASDPDLMIRCYEKAWAFEREITASRERAVAEEAALVAKFPMFPDFEILGTRHFVPYHEARDWWSDDALVERYHEISRMLVFMRRRLEFSAKGPVHDAKERDVLYECMRREKDHRFRKRIEDAIRRFYAFRAGLEKGDPATCGITNFEDAEVEVIHLPSLVDNEYGITFKKTDEYAVYSFHVFDDSLKISYSYFRTDLMFKERHYLMK